jgi:hypothetical protein
MKTKINRPSRQEIEKTKARHHKWLILALDVVIAISFLGICWIGVNIIQNFLPKHGDHVYNCSIAEIHPDFTPAMKQACREQFKKETK